MHYLKLPVKTFPWYNQFDIYIRKSGPSAQSKTCEENGLSYSNIRVAGGMTGRIPIQISLYKNEIILVLLRNGLLVAYSKKGLKLLWSIVIYGKGVAASKSSYDRKRNNEEVPSIDTDGVNKSLDRTLIHCS